MSLERDVKVLKIYALVATLSGAAFLTAFRSTKNDIQTQQEIRAKRFVLVDSAGTGRVLIAADYKRDNSAGVYFFNQEGTEAGALAYNGKRHPDGRVEAYSILTMDQFKNDELIRLSYNQSDKRKRYGLAISDLPDTLSAEARQVLADLGKALQSAKTTEEANTLRREYLSRVPAREIGARRYFAGREYDGSYVITLADPDGRPRLRLQVDTAGSASIVFLDAAGRIVRSITP
jgi:hypothetical protein